MHITEEQKSNALQYARENQVEYGLSCSESVLNALIRAGIVDLPEYYTCLATGLSGGVGASGNTCGAVYGAMMALGAVYGRKNPLAHPFEPTKKIPLEEDYRYYMMRRFNNLINDYVNHFGTCRCREFVDKCGGYFEKGRVDFCPNLIVYATELAIKYLEMDEQTNNALPYKHNIYGWK